jgi:DNA-binding NtrC family response regulator
VDAVEKPKVLIIDDEHIVSDTLALVFVKAGYDARAAYSAEDALAMIPGWTPSLAIIDVFLPGMDGIELAVRLKAEYPECKISLFSGEPGTADLLTASAHSFDVLAKPVTPDDMLETASRLLQVSREKKSGTAKAADK